MPLGDLNELPIPGSGLADDQIITEWGDKFASMLNPLIRTPIELKANYNFFFRGEIERDELPNVPAPSYVASWPAPMRKFFKIKYGLIDKRTGKKVWGWPGRVDYASKVLAPGPFGALQQQFISTENRRGQSRKQKLISYTTGARADRTDKRDVEIHRLFDHRKRLLKKRARMSQYGEGSADYGKKETPEYRRVARRIHQVEGRITELSRKRGDKAPLLGRAKRRSSGLPGFDSGGGSELPGFSSGGGASIPGFD